MFFVSFLKWNGAQFAPKGLTVAQGPANLKEFQKADLKLTEKGLIFAGQNEIVGPNGERIVAEGATLPSKIK